MWFPSSHHNAAASIFFFFYTAAVPRTNRAGFSGQRGLGPVLRPETVALGPAALRLVAVAAVPGGRRRHGPTRHRQLQGPLGRPRLRHAVLCVTPFRINTRTHSNVRREEAARCSASCVDRSDRFFGAVRPVAAGRTVTKPTNVSLGRPVGVGVRRVVLGSAAT